MSVHLLVFLGDRVHPEAGLELNQVDLVVLHHEHQFSIKSKQIFWTLLFWYSFVLLL